VSETPADTDRGIRRGLADEEDGEAPGCGEALRGGAKSPSGEAPDKAGLPAALGGGAVPERLGGPELLGGGGKEAEAG
jgi:hypothetical protein